MAADGLADVMASGVSATTGTVGKVADALGPLVGAAGTVFGPLSNAYNMVQAGLDMDRHTDIKDKIVDGIHMGTAALGTVLNTVAPGVGSVVENVANTVANTASYLTDLSTGQADPIPAVESHGGRNLLSNTANTITSSKTFNTAIRNFGSGTGGFGGFF
jgi:phage-related protein